MLDTYFKPIQGITKYQHFIFSNKEKGKVSVQSFCDSEEKIVNILKRGITIQRVEQARLPKIITPPGMTRERKQYLYDKIREHVWPEFRDITCPSS